MNISLSNILSIQEFKPALFDDCRIWFKAPHTVVIDPIVGDHSASDLIFFTRKEDSHYSNVDIEGQLQLIADSSSQKLIFDDGDEYLFTTNNSGLSLPNTETHLSSLSLYGSTLTNWSSQHKGSSILLSDSTARNLSIEKCESLVARSSHLHDMTLNLTTLSTEDCHLSTMKLISSRPHLNLNDTHFDDQFISEPVYGATLASQKMIKNLAGNSVQAMMYCSIDNGKLKILVEVGCWDGTIKEFRALLDASAQE